MTKNTVVLFALLIILSVNAAKASDTSREIDGIDDNARSDEDDNVSTSLQFVGMDFVNDKGDKIIKNDNLNKGSHNNEELARDTNSTLRKTKYEKLLKDSSDSDEVIFNRNVKNEKLLIPSGTVRKDNTEIEVVIAQMNDANDENNQKGALDVSEEDNSNWRSAEHLNSGVRDNSMEEVNDGISPEDDKDYSLEQYKDKKLDLNIMDRVQPREPDRREHTAKRPYHVRHFGPLDDHSVMDSGPLKSLGEIMAPRSRPKLPRNRLMYSPTLFALHQTRSPLLNRLTGHSWLQNRFQANPEREFFAEPRPRRVISLPQYEDSKMIDDYNDYGGNAYSYAPGIKVTTPAAPLQVVAPNKIDIFKKLAEASNHPKSAQRSFNDNIMLPGNYYPQRQYSDNYGPFNVRRFRRNPWDDEFYQNTI